MKKKLISILTAVLFLALAILPGCYFVNAQKMKNVKGTYKLVTYSRTDGLTNKTTDYVEKLGYEEYLIVTGSNMGYFVHKDNNQAAYSVEVRLIYEYDTEDSSLVSRVTYEDSLNSQARANSFGVTKDNLNVSIPRVYVTDWMNSDGYSRSFTKVDNATDLSYVKQQLGTLNEYTYESWKDKGVWEASSYCASVNDYEEPYVYYYVAVNGYDNQMTVYYALKTEDATPATAQQKTVNIPESWQAFTLDGRDWVKVNASYEYQETVGEGADAYTVSWRLDRVNAWYDVEDLTAQLTTALDEYNATKTVTE